MPNLHGFCLKTVRWSSWPLLALILGFLLTGYMIRGDYGLGRLVDEKQALALHRLLHGPLLVLMLAHTLPACYLAFRRWGWIRQ